MGHRAEALRDWLSTLFGKGSLRTALILFHDFRNRLKAPRYFDLNCQDWLNPLSLLLLLLQRKKVRLR